MLQGESAVGPPHDPGAVGVNLVVMAVTAQQAEVVHVGGAAVLPVNDVVSLTPVGVGPAADAAPIALGKNGALTSAGATFAAT